MDARHYNPKILSSKRNDLRKSQQQIADEMDVDRQTIYRVEAGKSASYEIIAALCAYYRIPTSDVVYSYPKAEVV